jgi:hypothetical protein
LEQARKDAARYCVKPSERGFHVWRFWPWETDACGWRTVLKDCFSREAAETYVLKQMGLADPEPQAPAIPQAVVTWQPPRWFA